jgi:hypothetical protein
MRKIMICLAASLITLTGANAFAQDAAPAAVPAAATPTAPASTTGTASSGLQVGVVGMVNFNTVSYSAEQAEAADLLNEGAGYKLGFGGGVRAIYEFTPMFGIQPEILFKQYGSSSEMTILGQTSESTTTTNYLHVPILARIALPFGGDMLTPKLLVGPTVGYFISGSSESDGQSTDIEGDSVNKLDIGVAAGLGADLAMGPGSLSLDLRYDRSFTSFAKEDDAGFSAVNTGFSFLVGYNYAL